ncbi:MAG: CrcB family protein [Actinomycetota bacterium]|nr:CrcB family protein [Actinomycetota bacterium]
MIGAAGVAGALARYAMSRIVVSQPGHFVWSTFWVNSTGSFLIGVVLVLVTERFPRARVARPLLVTGFLGAYTTFSTFVVDADLLVRSRDVLTGAVYVVTSVAAGLGAAVLGVVSARSLVGLDRRLDEQVRS